MFFEVFHGCLKCPWGYRAICLNQPPAGQQLYEGGKCSGETVIAPPPHHLHVFHYLPPVSAEREKSCFKVWLVQKPASKVCISHCVLFPCSTLYVIYIIASMQSIISTFIWWYWLLDWKFPKSGDGAFRMSSGLFQVLE